MPQRASRVSGRRRRTYWLVEAWCHFGHKYSDSAQTKKEIAVVVEHFREAHASQKCPAYLHIQS